MAAKTPAKSPVVANELAIANVRNEISFGDPDLALASYLGLDLTASADVLLEQAMTSFNLATRQMVTTGVLLARLKSGMTQPEFMALLDERGMNFGRAYELMRGAALAARLPEAQRDQVLALPKTKVIALASASPVVVEAMLEDGEADINLIGVRELRQRIRDLEAELTDTSVQRDTAESEAEGLRKKLAKGPKEREDRVPVVIADMRAEIAEAVKKAELALSTLQQLGPELMAVAGSAASDWLDPTLRLAVAGVASLQLQADGVLRQLATALPDADLKPTGSSYLSPQEVKDVAKAWAALTATHEHEKALREWERAKERPQGRGRPKARPEAPDQA